MPYERRAELRGVLGDREVVESLAAILQAVLEHQANDAILDLLCGLRFEPLVGKDRLADDPRRQLGVDEAVSECVVGPGIPQVASRVDDEVLERQRFYLRAVQSQVVVEQQRRDAGGGGG